jgi:uncharacterized heparinase superfamily protein
MPSLCRASGYARLQRGDTTLIADVGSPPPLELAGQAHAGCLAFELSSGRWPVLVNCGAPGPADQDWRAAARATASHNTLCIGSRSSSKLVRHDLLESLVGAPPIRFPQHVSAKIEDLPQEAIALEAQHDGYYRKFGIVHRRRLALDATGSVLTGTDSLGPHKGQLRLAADIPFAIHFHVHPDVGCSLNGKTRQAEISLPGGERWRLSAEGAQLAIEDGVHCADLSGPRRALQVVLRGACCGESVVQWVLKRAG